MERLGIMENTRHCSFRCDVSTWNRFKMICHFQDITVQKQLYNLIEQYVSKNTGYAGKESKRNIQSVSPS